ncbi:sensor histidine kinase [Senegalia massiliensis]|uniref:histidine kinase n=1 Tax=Senegalia massiliensis TaxID=1720316 RepID=A0A845R568_9CLOT|nr:HAMP domain-containing sensor histidine kinase [Senegalia massiliensis]NBI07653.1 sensor histidine kinase [Senegalia massiliensis]
MNNYTNILYKKFGLKFIISAILYTVIILLLFFLFKITLSDKVYFGYEPMYPFYHWADNNRIFLIFIVLSIGYTFIGLVLFNKSIKYMDEIITAIDEVYRKDDVLISLSGDLKNVTEKMNRIKFNLRENEKLAKDTEKRKNDLIIYLAHDLKTPLTSILGYLSILKDEHDLSNNFRKKYLQIVYDKSERLEELINEFFDITRYNLKDINLEKSNTDFSLMMEQIIYEFKPLLIDKNLNINSSIQSGVMINIDTGKIERVIDNVIRNAINYSYENTAIDISMNIIYDIVEVKVKNYGPTIPRNKLDYIFEEFYRLDSSRSSKTGGAGLGLAIAKSIIKAHGGSINAKSENEYVEMNIRIPF